MFRYVGIGFAGLLAGGVAANVFMIVVLRLIPASAWMHEDPNHTPHAHERRDVPPHLFAEEQPLDRAADDSAAALRDEDRPAPSPGRVSPESETDSDARPRRQREPAVEASPSAASDTAVEGSAGEESAPGLQEEDRSLAGRIRREVWRDDDGLYHIPRELADEVARDRSLVRSLVRRVTPYDSEDGTPLGIQLHGVGGLLSRVGVRDEDVLLSVNGIALDAPQRGAAAARALRESPSITLVVYRNGRQVALRYSLE